MILEQSFDLPLAPAQAWPLFHDVPMLVGCLPGASLSGPPDPAALPLTFAVKLGPMAAQFAGTGAVTFDEAAQAGAFSGQALDKRSQSRVKGEARFALLAIDGGTRVDVAVDYALTGPLAQFSRGAILREVANQLTARFAENLRARIADRISAAGASNGAGVSDNAAGNDAAGGNAAGGNAASGNPTNSNATSSSGGAALAGSATDPPSLNLLSLLAGAWRRWLARLFPGLSGRSRGNPR